MIRVEFIFDEGKKELEKLWLWNNSSLTMFDGVLNCLSEGRDLKSNN